MLARRFGLSGRLRCLPCRRRSPVVAVAWRGLANKGCRGARGRACMHADADAALQQWMPAQRSQNYSSPPFFFFLSPLRGSHQPLARARSRAGRTAGDHHGLPPDRASALTLTLLALAGGRVIFDVAIGHRGGPGPAAARGGQLLLWPFVTRRGAVDLCLVRSAGSTLL